MSDAIWHVLSLQDKIKTGQGEGLSLLLTAGQAIIETGGIKEEMRMIFFGKKPLFAPAEKPSAFTDISSNNHALAEKIVPRLIAYASSNEDHDAQKIVELLANVAEDYA